MVDTKLHDACVRKIVSEWCGKSLQQLIDIDIDIAGSHLQIEQIGLKGQNVPAVLAYTYVPLHRWDVMVYEMGKGGKSIYSDPFAFLRENMHLLLKTPFGFTQRATALPLFI